MDPLLYCFLSFVVGTLVQATDWVVDELPRSIPKKISFITALAYGLSGGFLVSRAAPLASLFLGVALGVFVAGKIDARAHQLGAAVLLASSFVLGFSATILLIVFFAFFAALDEFLHERARSFGNKLLQRLAAKRASLEAAALGASVYFTEPLYFAALVSFDAGTWLVSRFTKKRAPAPHARGVRVI